VHGLRQVYHRVKNRFGRARWNSLVRWVMWNLVLVHSEMVLVSGQGRCMACTKRTIGSRIILDPLDGTPR
jgi:hypothetical protein